MPASLQEQLLALEKQLAEPAVRREPKLLTSLLADEFVEFGSSGRIYNKEQIISTLVHQAAGEISICDLKMLPIAPQAALVTYKATINAEHKTIHSLRSSLWLLREGRWQIVFHQGTTVFE